MVSVHVRQQCKKDLIDTGPAQRLTRGAVAVTQSLTQDLGNFLHRIATHTVQTVQIKIMSKLATFLYNRL